MKRPSLCPTRARIESESSPRRVRSGSLGLLRALCWQLVALVWAWNGVAFGQAIQPTELPARPAQLRWDVSRRQLFTWVVFRDAISPEVRAKLSRGLPTTVVMTALLHVAGQEQPVATTVQSCKTTWHVWEEMYRVELTRPNEAGRVLRHWTPTLNGVLRRCAQATRLLVATSPPVPAGPQLSLRVNVQVNPLGEELLRKIQHWITLPARATPANPGGALLGTFTRLFMARVGEAEFVAEFTTATELPESEEPPAL